MFLSTGSTHWTFWFYFWTWNDISAPCSRPLESEHVWDQQNRMCCRQKGRPLTVMYSDSSKKLDVRPEETSVGKLLWQQSVTSDKWLILPLQTNFVRCLFSLTLSFHLQPLLCYFLCGVSEPIVVVVEDGSSEDIDAIVFICVAPQ